MDGGWKNKKKKEIYHWDAYNQKTIGKRIGCRCQKNVSLNIVKHHKTPTIRPVK